MDGLMDDWINGRVHECMDICVDAWMYVWDGCINASVHGCMEMK